MPGIGVVVNPQARGNRRRTDRAERLAEIVGDAGVVRETAAVTQLAETAREFAARDLDVLAVCGGDGSIFRVFSALIPAYGDRPLPAVLPLRAGTINFVAAAIGCRRGPPEKVLAHVVRNYCRGIAHDTTERDLLCVNGTQYGFVIGCGAVVNFLRAYYAQQGTGPLYAIRLLARVVVSALAGGPFARGIVQPVEADITCDGERVPFRLFTVVLAGTVDRVALGFRPLYLGDRKRGYLHLVGGPFGAREFLRCFGRLRKGFPTEEPTLYDNLGRMVSIRFARPAAYMIDGDVAPPVTQLDVATGPRVILIRG
jgi:diacylglycerol kinase family enzyme